MLGDNHAAWTIGPQVSAATAFPEVAGELGCSQGLGRASRGSAAPKIVDSAGVMGSSSAGERAGYSDHGVPGSLVGAGVVEPRGFRWTGRSARLDSHVWDAG